MNDSIQLPIAGVKAGEPGQVDFMLSTLADRLDHSGYTPVGAVQHDTNRIGRTHCEMAIRILGTDLYYPISSDLGPLSRGCRLDSAALEQAAHDVEALLRSLSGQTQFPHLLIINKFSKSEAKGKGFLPAIILAIELGIPVLCGIGRLCLSEFSDFADGYADLIEPRSSDIEQWAANSMSNSPKNRGPLAVAG